MIAPSLSQRLEGGNRDKQKEKPTERMVTRGVAKENSENIQKHKIGPPPKKSEVAPKKVAFEPSSETVPKPRHDGLGAKGKTLPYIDVPPLKSSLRAPVTESVKTDQNSKNGPVYKSIAPVEIGVDIEKLVESVLDLEISVPLRNLAGVSGAIQKEIRKQVTKSRVPVELKEPESVHLNVETEPLIRIDSFPMAMYAIMTEVSDEVPEGHLIADDPILQYLAEHQDVSSERLVVAAESDPLRAIYMTVNRLGQEECLVDSGSMIVSMAKAAAVDLGLTWDPSIRINMESASNHVEKTLGLAKNVQFATGGLDIFLQVHILENPPYRVLLGRPFERFTSCTTHTKTDGSSELVLTDPNTKKVAVVTTYERGRGPEELTKQRNQDF